MEKEELVRLRDLYRQTLLRDCLPFWLKYGWDRNEGGIITSLDRNGNVIDSDKGVWQQGRFAWTLGYAYNNLEKNPLWLEAMESTLSFISRNCIDQDGRLFFQVTQQGAPIRKRRYCFSEAFASMAYGEHYKAVGCEESARMAKQLYQVYDNHIVYPPKNYATRPMKSLGHFVIQINLCQRLRDCLSMDCLTDDIDHCIDEIKRDFIKDEYKCCMESVGLNGEILDHFDGRLLNPGHTIEGSWFIMEEGYRRNRPDYIELGLRMLDYGWSLGWDEEYGGIIYYRDVYNKPIAEYWADEKFWWPQNEALIATLMAWFLTHDEKYANMYRKIHEYTYRLFPDREGMDWFGYFSRDGHRVTDLKGNIYKGCFHMPRQQMVCLEIVEKALSDFHE